MLTLLDINKTSSGLTPITSGEIFVGKTVTFHPEGLFSERIFGPADTGDRRRVFSFISLNCKVLHPSLVVVLKRLEQKLFSALSGEGTYSIDENGVLQKDDNGPIKGFTSVIENFDKIKFRGGTKDREDLAKMIYHYRKQDQVFIDKILVIPPGHRDVTIFQNGEVSYAPINDYYLKVLRLSSQMESMQKGTVYDIFSNRMNDLVKELYDYLISKVSKKSGLLRKNMLGKRIDFTGRAVISGASTEVKPNEIGVPFKLLVKLFEPFILYELLNSGRTPKEQLATELEKFNGSKLSANSLRKLFIGIYKHDEIPEGLENILKDAVRRTIKNKVVIAKRDPALHAESVQAFTPVLIEGNTIKIHPLKCEPYNADFDGDQMALYVPITRQAIEEAKEKMMVVISKAATGKISDDFNKDASLGIYILTKEPKTKETKYRLIKHPDELSGLDIYTLVDYDGHKTSAGRAIFNNILPKQMPFINEEINTKKLNLLATKIYEKYGEEVYVDFADKACKLSFKYGTIYAPSFSMEDFEVPKSILDVKTKLKGQPPEKVSQMLDNTEEKLKKHLETKESNLGIMGKAGVLKGGYGQARQILVAKGLIQDNTGKILDPITESYAEGFDSKEFFTSGAGSRKGIADRVLNTADTGYLSRKLVYALQRVEVDPTIYNCKTNRPFKVKVTPDIAKRLTGRYLLTKDGKPVPIGDPSKYIGKVISLKSPLYCLTRNICTTCYGDLANRNRTRYVGVLAAQIFGERGTQLIMRTFHTGGAVSVASLDLMSICTKTMNEKESALFKNSFHQKDNDLVADTDGVLVADTREYSDPKRHIIEKNGIIQFEYGYFNLFLGNTKIELTIDNPLDIDTSDKKITSEGTLTKIEFSKGSNLFISKPVSDNIQDKLKVILQMLDGKKPFRSADHFTMNVFDLYGGLAEQADFIHFEILTSHLLRDSRNPSYPARLNTDYSATVVSLKKISSYESWLSALSFENPNEAITTGLLYERDKKESVLEKIVNGTL